MKIIKNLRTLAQVEARTGLKFCVRFRNCISPISRQKASKLAELGYQLVRLDGFSYPFLARLPVELPKDGSVQEAVTVKQAVSAPASDPLPKVIIHLEGGLVQTVYANMELDVQVYDLDLSEFATPREIEEEKALAAEFEAEIKNLQQVY